MSHPSLDPYAGAIRRDTITKTNKRVTSIRKNNNNNKKKKKKQFVLHKLMYPKQEARVSADTERSSADAVAAATLQLSGLRLASLSH